MNKQQKQPFTSVLWKNCLEIFCNIHRKTHVWESFIRLHVNDGDIIYVQAYIFTFHQKTGIDTL